MEDKREIEKVELAPPIDYFLNMLTQTKPYFPEYLSRQLCQEIGLECSDDLFFKMVSVLVDCQLKNLVQDMGNTRVKRKKDEEERTLKTSNVEKLFKQMGVSLDKGHFYPNLGIDDKE